MLESNEILSEDFILNEDIDLENYYLYFVIYRSPNIGSPTAPASQRWNLYVGIKNMNIGYEPASKFFGSIRFNGTGNEFAESESYFYNNIFRLVDERARKSSGEIYMTSAVDKNPESLTQAYVLGIYHQREEYHPLICNDKVFLKIDSMAGKQSLLDKLKSAIKEFFSKISKSTTNESVVVEDSPSKSTKAQFFPLSVKDHLKFAKSSNYGYKVYVCEDMALYLEELDKMLKDTKDDNFKGKKALQKEKEELTDDTSREQRFQAIASRATERYYDLMDSSFDDFMSEKEYRRYCLKQITENPVLQIPSGEGSVQIKLKEIGEIHQGYNAKIDGIFTNQEVFEQFWLPDTLTAAEKKKAVGLFFGENKVFDSSVAKKGPKTYRKLEKMMDDDELAKEIKRVEGSNFKQAVLSFTATNNYITSRSIREHGFDEDDAISTLIWNNSNNLLKSAYEKKDKEAIKKLKHIFTKKEFIVGVLKHGNKSLEELSVLITLKKDGKDLPHFVTKVNDELQLTGGQTIDKKVYNEGATYVNRQILFTMFDFIQLLGYKVNNNVKDKKGRVLKPGREKMIDFGARIGLNTSRGITEEEEVSLTDMLLEKISPSKTMSSKDRNIVSMLSRGKDKDKDKVVDKKLKSDGFVFKVDNKKEKKKEEKTEKAKKGTQNAKYNKLAFDFAKSLLGKNPPKFNAIFFSDNNGASKKVSIAQLQKILKNLGEKKPSKLKENHKTPKMWQKVLNEILGDK